MENKLISVIIPVYNVQNYIRDCVDSVLAQSISDFELILIDDGSTDNSGSICDELQQKDLRIKVVHKQNGGPSTARNKGLDIATGEYICFVDSDDMVRNDYLEKLYKAIVSSNADVALCDVDSPKLAQTLINCGSHLLMTQADCRHWLYDMNAREYVLMVVPWNKLFAKHIFSELRYPIGKDHEDEYIIGPIIDRLHLATYVDERLYYYRDNSSGFTSEENKFNIKHLDCVGAYVERIDNALKIGDKEFARITAKNAMNKCARLYRDAKKIDDHEYMSASRNKYAEVYDRFQTLLSRKQRLKYRLFLLLPGVFIKRFNP